LYLDGKRIEPANPIVARSLGISMVHQELAFCPNLTVAENLCLGDLPQRAGWLDRNRLRDRARGMLREIEADLDVDVPIATLSTGQEQLVQIAAALATNARVIVMDEPTSSLSAHESEHLFKLLGQLKTRNITVIYVSHRMEEIFRLCDAVTVLRDGRHVSTSVISGTSPERVINEMVGREVRQYTSKHLERELGEEILRVENLSSPGALSRRQFRFAARRSNRLRRSRGRGPQRNCAGDLWPRSPGDGACRCEGPGVAPGNVRAALRAGVGLLPEDRKRLGLVLSMNCRENTSLAVLPRLTRAGFVRSRQERALVNDYVGRLRVKTPDIDAVVAGLSGGNQQKIALAKWLARKCDVLIVDEPTRGVDVGSEGGDSPVAG
jgi:ABC-type sugar transport system ATPase subunit